MSLRTPSTDYYRQALLNLQNVQEQMAQNTQRLTSGNQITSPGDNPTGTATILDFQNSIQANTQFLAQATAANGLLQSAVDAIGAAIDEANNLQVLAQSALGAVNTTPGGMANAAPQVEAIRANLLTLANTQFQGKYIFAGTATTTQPFTDAGPPAGAVSYQGNPGIISLGVSATAMVATNIPGSTVFSGVANGVNSATGLFQIVNNMHTALSNNDANGVKAVAADLSNIMGNLYQQQAAIGGRQAGLNDLQTTISGINLSLQGMQSTIQATNYPETYTNLTNEQTQQSAILSTMAKTNTNLFNYLG